MNIVSQVAECFDDLVRTSKKAAREFFGEITYDFSEKPRYDIDLTTMKCETQQMFKNIIYGGL